MRMSTSATSGLCMPTWRSRSSAVPLWATTSKPGVLEQARDSLAQQDRVVGEDYAHAAKPSASGAERGKRRELARDVELIEALRLAEPRQLVVAQILELVRRVELVPGPLRDQDLAAAARLRDPRSPMDVDAVVGAFAERSARPCACPCARAAPHPPARHELRTRAAPR